jgi:hypothetical protein
MHSSCNMDTSKLINIVWPLNPLLQCSPLICVVQILMELAMAIPQICFLELLQLMLCKTFKVLKWKLLPNLDLHRFGLFIFQLEYSLVPDMWLDHSPIDSLLRAQNFIQVYKLQ